MAKLKILILFGGENSEYDVSLKSAYSIISNIDTKKYYISLVGITKKGRWLYYPGDISGIKDNTWFKNNDCVPAFISPDKITKGIVKVLEDNTCIVEKIDVIFPVLHGKNAEDGTIQGLLQLSGIPFVGCGTLSSAICMDKVITNTILDYNQINHTKWTHLENGKTKNVDEKISLINENFKYPLFVKPANAGSSVGVSRVTDCNQLKNAIQLAFIHDKKVLIEEGINGREVEVAVMGNCNPICSSVGEVVVQNGFYDYESKYINSSSEVVIPANIDNETVCKIKDMALNTYNVLECKGLTRVDFFIEKDTNKLYINEVNTMPGFTDISMYPKLFIDIDMSYKTVINNLINLAIETSYNLVLKDEPNGV
ncbi:MAG: D-alanine--D-alanine ligase family protein [Oscillospiraceae bacterium]